MLRRIFIIIVLIFLAIGAWVWYSATEVIRMERDVETQFNELVSYYVQMDKLFLIPLIETPNLLEADRVSLVNISSDLKNLGNVGGTSERYKKLLVIQREMISYFTTPGLSEMIVNSPAYAQWNSNATSRGQASSLILSYNRALAGYTSKKNSIIGKLMGNWPNWPYTEFLSLDGKTQTSSLIRF